MEARYPRTPRKSMHLFFAYVCSLEYAKAHPILDRPQSGLLLYEYAWSILEESKSVPNTSAQAHHRVRQILPTLRAQGQAARAAELESYLQGLDR